MPQRGATLPKLRYLGTELRDLGTPQDSRPTSMDVIALANPTADTFEVQGDALTWPLYRREVHRNGRWVDEPRLLFCEPDTMNRLGPGVAVEFPARSIGLGGPDWSLISRGVDPVMTRVGLQVTNVRTRETVTVWCEGYPRTVVER